MKSKGRVVLALLVAGLFVSGCEKPEEEGPGEEIGKQLDRSMEELGEDMEDARQELGRKMEETGERMQRESRGE